MRGQTDGFKINRVMFGFLSMALLAVYAAAASAQDSRPNILVFLTDDMGYTDLGAFGGNDVSTPNLDRLAYEGLRLTNFHAAPSCAPTRSMLMTGTGNHEAGFGTQIKYPEFLDAGPEYEAVLADGLSTLPRILQQSGYFTLMSGKWHLAGNSDDASNFAGNRGFDRAFTLLDGGDHHLGTVFDGLGAYTENGARVPRPPDIHSTDLFADKLVDYLHDVPEDAPFFAYFAPTAPHWPLHPSPLWLDQYAGVYDAGYENLCQQRMAGARAAGVLPDSIDASVCPLLAEPWNALSDEQRAANSRAMELYASMLEHVDQQFGRLLAYLDETNRLQNTWVLVLNDNGPQGESPLGGVLARVVGDLDIGQVDTSIESMGTKASWPNVGQGWADAMSAPFRGNKGTQYEGGIRVPAFVWSGRDALRKDIDNSFLTVMDIMPTLLELGAVDQVEIESLDLRGRSFLPLMFDPNYQVHDWQEPIILDSAGRSVIFFGDYKMVRPLYGDWELYDLAHDPGETEDISLQQPRLVQQLTDEFRKVAATRNYIPRQNRSE